MWNTYWHPTYINDLLCWHEVKNNDGQDQIPHTSSNSVLTVYVVMMIDPSLYTLHSTCAQLHYYYSFSEYFLDIIYCFNSDHIG